MNNTTISDTMELSKGAPINTLTATVKKAFEPQEGESRGVPWRLQAVILQDDTGEIRTTFWNRFNTDFRNFEGESLTIVSGRDKKDKFSGITTDDYKGKRQLKVTEYAKFDSPDGDEPQPDEPEKNPVTAGANTDEEINDLNATTNKASERRFVTEIKKRESIEKQVALKAAVEYSVAHIESNASGVLETAKAFYKFLHGTD